MPETVDSWHQEKVITALGAAPDVGGSPVSGGWVMAAGTGDGQLVLFDARERGQQAVQQMKGHKGNWVVDVYFTVVGLRGGGAVCAVDLDDACRRSLVK